MSASHLPSPLVAAALGFARRGWPVFPCNPKNKQPLLAADKDPITGKPIKGTGGVSKATSDEQQILAWWKKWPDAMIGLAMGRNGLFALDFDPRVEEVADEATGEITKREWTLEQLKAETEAQIGCALPETLAVRTPSGGVHLYLRQPGGDPIKNRGNLPLHVDVRGAGGYVIAPPSRMDDGRHYRWLRGNWNADIAEAPAELVDVLRAPKARPPSGEAAAPVQGASASPSPRSGASAGEDPGEAAKRRYAMAALDSECEQLRKTPLGNRDNQANASGFTIGQLVGAGAIGESFARAALHAACLAFGDPAARQKAVDNGLEAGMAQPRDLSDIAEQARRRPPPRSPARTGGAARNEASFHSGRQADDPAAAGGGRPEEPLTTAEKAQFGRLAKLWLDRRVERVEQTPKALTALAWSAGRRISAGLLDVNEVKEAIWPECEDVADIAHADIDRAIDDGIARGFDARPLRLHFRCSQYPLTDFGIAERFRDRFGREFRFTTAKGWLGWDGKRWKVLDQDKETPPAELVAAVFETIRAIQDEARAVRDTGVRWRLIQKGKTEEVDEADEGNPHGLDQWLPKGRSFELKSTLLAIFGRASETAGKPVAVANLARRWLTVPIEAFDCEQLAINLLNGTLRFGVREDEEGRCVAWKRLDPHRRRDLITKIAPIDYDAEAQCPVYDSMLEWAQPEAQMRRYLHQVGGYASTGDTGEHLLWFNYGRGRNGKSTTIDSWCAALGDYSGTIGIESFLDQGVKKRGDQATPDLAKLGGVRMLRASEPERDAKLNSALIKAATGGEPMSVRALHRGFFDLLPRFKLLMSGNSKPSIPETDDGIWGRMKLVPWRRHIDKPDEDPFKERFPENHAQWPKKDPHLTERIKAKELSGVFNRLVGGLLDKLEHGFVEPKSVKEATQDYREASDPLARFLKLCTVHDPAGRIQSSRLHEVFVAWCKAAGEKEWSNKGLSNAMIDKGFTKKASDGMQWLGLRLVRQATDFVDENGRVKALPDDMAMEPPNEDEAPPDRAPERPPPDDYVPGFDPDPGLPI